MRFLLLTPVEIRLDLRQNLTFLGPGSDPHFLEVVKTHGAVL
jgi:hypothetical protein